MNEDEVRKELWSLLQRRLQVRTSAKLPLGSSDQVEVKFPRHSTRRTADLSLDADGKLILGEMLNTWPDELRNVTPVLPLVLAEVYELIRVGLLRPHPGGSHLYITAHGARCLTSGDPFHPFDGSGRVATFRTEFASSPNVDLIGRYLGEACEAHRNGMPLAGATVIGCAYELAVLELADSVVARWSPDPSRVPGLDKDERRAMTRVREGEPATISHVAEAVFKALVEDKAVLGRDHWDWADAAFRATFALVRRLRNKAGHPTGAHIARDDVWTHILLLPEWYRHVRAIVGLLSQAGVHP